MLDDSTSQDLNVKIPGQKEENESKKDLNHSQEKFTKVEHKRNQKNSSKSFKKGKWIVKLARIEISGCLGNK